MPLGVASAAACIASAARLDNLAARRRRSSRRRRRGPCTRPGSARRSRPPAGASGSVALSCSRAARLATKMAGWLTSVAFSRSAGRWRRRRAGRSPRTADCPVEEALAAGSDLAQCASHADRLCALTGEEEGSVRGIEARSAQLLDQRARLPVPRRSPRSRACGLPGRPRPGRWRWPGPSRSRGR